MDKLLEAVKNYQREVMANFAHDDRQSYWRGKLQDAIHEAEGTSPAPAVIVGHTPTPGEIAATETAAAQPTPDNPGPGHTEPMVDPA